MHRREFLSACAVVGFGAMAPVGFKAAGRLWVPRAREMVVPRFVFCPMEDRKIVNDLLFATYGMVPGDPFPWAFSP